MGLGAVRFTGTLVAHALGMKHLSGSRIRVAAALLIAVGLFAGCGGRAGEPGAGTTTLPGAGAAGEGFGESFAGESGMASDGGASGTATALCSLPLGGQVCDGYSPVFQHDPKTGLCEPTVFGGCGGTANVFGTRADCELACPGGGANWGSCQSDADCTLATVTCACEPLGEVSFVALSVRHAADFAGTQNQNCPACEAVTQHDATGKYFKPVCASGQCSALDIRKSPITECVNEADCTLRDGASCCQGCTGQNIVAVNGKAQLCDVAQPCPSCATHIPSDLSPTCSGGRCELAAR